MPDDEVTAPEEVEVELELVTAPDEVETLPEDVEVEVETPPVELVTAPEDVETPPVLVETPPVEVETPPVVVELPPVEVDVELPPVEVEVEPPVEVKPPVEVDVEPPVVVRPPVELEEDVEPPDDDVEPPEVEVDPPLVVELITTLPPLDPPPPKKPPKKPPPQPPIAPPPTTTGTPPPLASIGCCGRGGSGAGMAIIAISGWAGAQVRVVVTTRRMRLVLRGAALATRWAVWRLAVVPFDALAYWTWAAGASATWTAPPPTSAPPAAQADNFARAIRTDISVALCCFPWGTGPAGRLIRLSPCHEKRREFLIGQRR